jgi:hypothetical protein
MVPRLQSWMSMQWLAVGCASAIAACSEAPGSSAGSTPDGAAPEFTGLTLEFIADAELPAQLDAVRVDEIYLSGSVIRAVGDATTEDERPTTGYDHELRWDRDTAPRALAFSAAPVGEYAYVEIRIAGQPNPPSSAAFELRGEARRGDGWTDFTIRAAAPIVIAKAPAAMRLEAGRPLAIHLELDVSRLLDGVDWAELPERDGRLRLDEQTPAALASFCAVLGGAFQAR